MQPIYIQSLDHYVLVPATAVAEIAVNFPPIAAIKLRRDSVLLRMRNIADALCAKMVADHAVVGLDRIAQRDTETVTAIVYSDPVMARQCDVRKPNVPAYCKSFADALGGGTIICHQDHSAYDGVLSRVTLPLKWLFRKNWRIGNRMVGGLRPYDLPWNSFFAVFFDREPALAMLLACLGGELQLHDIAHIRVNTMDDWFAVYDRLRPRDGYTGNHPAQDAYFAEIGKVAA